MAKVRVHQVAKDLGMKSGDLVNMLNQMGIQIASHSSTVDESIAHMVKMRLGIKTPEPEPVGPEPEPVAAVPEEPKPAPATPAVKPPVKELPQKPQPRPEPVKAAPAPAAPVVEEEPKKDESELTEAERRRIERKRRREEERDRKQDEEERRRREQEEAELLAELDRIEKDEEAEREAAVTTIQIGPVITVAELAKKLRAPVNELILELMQMNLMRSANQEIPSDIASRLAEAHGLSVEVSRAAGAERQMSEADRSKLKPTAPVVTIMGHVDHGKTTLLDRIRNTNVQATEAGAITQHIGAYETEYRDKRIVFLDTPGHQAFTAMRARGAHVTDIAVLVVAADDGVMPQTVEAIDHARAAGVPIVVAVNKMDRPNANPDRVLQQLAEMGLVPEDWGGDTICVKMSAAQGTGIADLLENLLLVAEIEDIRANPDGQTQGVVLEAHLEPQRGPVATILVQQGTLKVGDDVVVGATYGRIRNLENYRGESLKKAGPATPVTVYGLVDVPDASDSVIVAKNSKEARQLAAKVSAESRRGMSAGIQRASLEDLFAQVQQGQTKDLNVIVKADVQGSVEAITASLRRLSQDQVRVNIIHSGVGNVSESDIMLAATSNAVVLGFNVKIESAPAALSRQQQIDVRIYDVIYDLLNDVEAAMLGLLEPVYEQRLSGVAEVRALFKSSRAGTIAGCMVTEGKVVSGQELRVVRGGTEIYRGTLSSLRHVKEVVKEIPAGMECGISLSAFDDFQEGDRLESYVTVEIPRSLERRTA